MTDAAVRPESELLELTRSARALVGEAGRLLRAPSPAVFEISAVPLEQAASALSCLEQALRGRAPADELRQRALRQEILALQRELELVRALLEQAGRFYDGWAQILFAAAESYTPQGEGKPAALPGQLSVNG